ncbi:hypothetical protein Fcan01_22018 [Folsomia candida]|uniref:Uncharacterized protein n=1 Tax=Folsomia candida TaxID=158441 RepID=A0A226DGB3_FOLCA|nr:hypothetical protein Fcan01_22018 [Folsomia candida]
MANLKASMGLPLLFLTTFGVRVEGSVGAGTHVKLEITDYLIPFKNCVLIVQIPNNASYVLRHKATYAPIILYTLNLRQGEIIDTKFSKQVRRNPSPHCWASFIIFPEKHDSFKLEDEYIDTTFGPDFIRPHWPNQYFTWITTAKNEIQQRLRRYKFDGMYRGAIREDLIIELAKNNHELLSSNDSVIRVYYDNQYYMDTPIVGMEQIPRWSKIDCLPNDCFKLIESMVMNDSMKNKYFWTSYFQITTYRFTTINELLSQFDLSEVRSSRHGLQKIANLLPFNTFVSYWILQDVVHHSLENVTFPHIFNSIIRPPLYWQRNFKTLVAHGVQRLTHVSCYGVKPVNSGYLFALTNPFDSATWTCIFISISVFILICAVLSIPSNGGLFAIGMILEISASELSFHISNKYVRGVNTLIVIWALMVGIILTNLYKTFYTMEMIVPKSYTSSWKTIAKLEELRIMIPFNLLLDTEVDPNQIPDLAQHGHFFQAVMERLLELWKLPEDHSRLGANVRLARKLMNIILPPFGIGSDLKSYRNGTFNRYEALGVDSNYNKSNFSYCPIQPILYTETNLALKTLSPCGKTAFMDTKENIDAK